MPDAAPAAPAARGVYKPRRPQASPLFRLVVEGNTNNDGSSNGNTTLRKVRTFRESDGHKFIRWVEMGRKAVAA